MKLEDLAWDLVMDARCSAPNSEGRRFRLSHDFTDIYARWHWKHRWYIIWYPVRRKHRQCLRCKREVRILRP